MFRIDAHHSFQLPGQTPDWYGKILRRSKFAGSVYVPGAGSIEDAVGLASQNPYIRRVVPAFERGQPSHPLIVSAYLADPTGEELEALESRGLQAEIDASRWPVETANRIALIGMPEANDLPPNVYIKLTGFRLPATPEQAGRLRQLLRHPGPERLMFASGWPHGGGTWKETLAAFTQCLGPMPIPLREQLLGDTARAFYRL